MLTAIRAHAYSRRTLFTAIHLLLSLGFAGIAAIVVFLIWYPGPFASMTGGVILFLLLVTIDVILGPTLTAIVAQPSKTILVLKRDVFAIVAIQFVAFCYGMYAVAMARPVYLSFEVDRMRVVTAADIDPTTLPQAQPAFQSLPWSGPKIIASERPTKPEEAARSLDLALAGFDISVIPQNWRDFAIYSNAAWSAAKPLNALLAKYPDSIHRVEQLSTKTKQPIESLRFLPVTSRKENWVAVLTPDARIVGYLPFDGFI